MALPSLFIGSSSEGKEVAWALKKRLYRRASITVWDQGFFAPGDGTLHKLVNDAPTFDFAVLVLTPDDMLEFRGKNFHAPRDNILFELGLFIGAIGMNRTYVVASDSSNLKIPSDLAGITFAMYSQERVGDLSVALERATRQIGARIQELGPCKPECHVINLNKLELRVMKGNLFDHCSPSKAVLLPANVYLDTTAEGDIVNERSTLGKMTSLLATRHLLSGFDADIDMEIKALQPDIDAIQDENRLQKPGRQRPCVPGSTVQLKTELGVVVLLSLSRMERFGGAFKVCFSEDELTSALRNLWANLAKAPVREDLYMPIIGSGFGGLPRSIALAHIILTFCSAEPKANNRPCRSLNIVVHENDWGDGVWVSQLVQGLSARRH